MALSQLRRQTIENNRWLRQALRPAQDEARPSIILYRLSFVFLVAAILFELLFLLFFRRVNLDEGWYLGAAKLVYAGKVLYQDFAYTQTPLLPYVYGLFGQLFGIGLYQGRALTVLLALGAWLLSAATAQRLAGQRAGLLCLALLATSCFAATQYSYTATYALTACLIAAALYVSLLSWRDSTRNVVATLLICLAVCTRLSTIVVLPPFLLYLLLTSRAKWRAFGWIGGTTLATLGLILGYFWLHSPELMRYDIWGFHLDRILRTRWRLLKIRERTLRTALDFGVPILLNLGAIFWYGRVRSAWRARNRLIIPTVILMVTGLFVAHLVPRTTDSYYNALQLPMMCLVGSVLLARSWPQGRKRRVGWVAVVASLLLLNGALQLRAVWRDGVLTVPLHNQIALVRRTAALVAQYVPVTGTLLTFDQHLALEAARATPPGYEMSIFAYRPTWPTEQARAYKMINNEILLTDLASPVAGVAFTEFDLEQIYGERDAFFATLHTYYRWFYTIDHFGPYGDTLYLYFPPQFQAQPPQVTYQSTFADGIELLGYDLTETTLDGQPILNVALYWQARQTPTQDYTVFVQLLDPSGKFVTGFDNPPCHRTCPTTSWQPGEFLRDEYQLPLAGVDRTQEYQLQIGLYDGTGTRLKILAGHYAGEDRIILTTLPVAID